MFSPSLNAGSLQSAIFMANDILTKKASFEQRQQKLNKIKSMRKNATQTRPTKTTTATTVNRKKLAKSATTNAKSSTHHLQIHSTIPTYTRTCESPSMVSSQHSEPISLPTSTGSVEKVQHDEVSLSSYGSSKCHSTSNMTATTTNSRNGARADMPPNRSTHPTAETQTRHDARDVLLDESSTRSASTHSRSDFFFQHSIVVDNIWQIIKKSLVDYEYKLGEQILLRMMEMNSNARYEMRLTSLRSPRFAELTKMVIVVVDLMVSVFGPDLDVYAQDLELLGQECAANGIQISLLAKAVPDALQLALMEENIDFNADDRESWTVVVETVAQDIVVGS